MTEPNIAFVANLMAAPSRAAMCLALVGGEARPAGELAARAGVSAQTVSNTSPSSSPGASPRVEQQRRRRNCVERTAEARALLVDGKDHIEQLFVDQVRLGRGLTDLIVALSGAYESAWYTVYEKKGRQWREAYQGPGVSC